MRRRLLVSLVVLSLLVGVAAGSAAAAPRAGATAPGPWAKTVCISLTTWQSSLERRSKAIEASKPTNLAKLYDAFASFLANVVRDTDRLIAKTKAAGTPSVPRGAQVAGALLTGYGKLRTYFAADAAKAKHLSRTNAASFAAGAAAIGRAIERQSSQVGKTFDALDKKYRSAALDSAMKSTPACRGIS